MSGLDLPLIIRLWGRRNILWRFSLVMESFTCVHVSRHKRLEVQLAFGWVIQISFNVSVYVSVVLSVFGAFQVQRLDLLQLLMADLRSHC